MSEMSFWHFSHIEHPLGLYSIPEGLICQMCNLPFPDDGIGYACRDCFHLIHKNCAEFPQQITTHSLHNHSLTLPKTASSRSTSSCCHYCDKPISVKEYAYGCEQCPNFRMHMTCAVIPLPIMQDCTQGGDAGYKCHGNPMKLVPRNEFRKGEAKCFACQTPWDGGSAYSCASSTCENFFHKSCWELPRKIQHPFHRRHALTLQVSKPRSCDSCCKKECRLIFCCFEERCDLSLGLECACYNHTFVKYQSHDHSLALVEKASCDDIHCEACRKTYKKLSDVDQILIPKEVDRTRSLLFRCMECSHNLHFLCGPLPFRIKYEYHIHPLTLVDHSTVEDTGSDEFYCDACEEERDQTLRFYYCSDCKYSAHIHCVLTEIMKVIKGGAKDVDLKAFGEDRWDSEKELKDDHNTNATKWTLRDVMDRLSESEKKMLINPYHDSYPYIIRLIAHHNYAQCNTCLDREGSVEDIIRAPQIFNFHVAHFLDFFGELSYFSPAGGLKLDDNYLRQEVQDVNGYMVPKTLVPVLTTLLHEYGYLGEDSSLSPEMKSVGSTLLCAAVERMYRTRVEDITRDDLRHLFFNLQGVAKIANFKATMGYLDALTAHIMPAFLGLEAMRYKKDMTEKLDHKIATLEAELKRWKENREMLDKCEAEPSDFMKMCWAKASKWGRKYCAEIWL